MDSVIITIVIMLHGARCEPDVRVIPLRPHSAPLQMRSLRLRDWPTARKPNWGTNAGQPGSRAHMFIAAVWGFPSTTGQNGEGLGSWGAGFPPGQALRGRGSTATTLSAPDCWVTSSALERPWGLPQFLASS